MNKKLFLALALMYLCVAPTSALAQLGGLLGGSTGIPQLGQQTSPQSQMEIGVFPEFPAPGETFTASLEAYTLNTQGAEIFWFVNGDEQTGVRNQRSLTVTAGSAGETIDLAVQLVLPNGPTLSKTHSVTPTRLDIIIEPETIVPLHYQGRALATRGSVVRVVAIPVDDKDASEYTYTWTLDSTVLFRGPVLGKQVARFEIPSDEYSALLTVSVADKDGVVISRKTIDIPITDPEILFYEDNPLRGMNKNTIGNPFLMLGEETVVRAEPYNLPNLQLSDTLIEWDINGQEITNPGDDPLELTIRRQGSAASFAVKFHIRNLNNLMQGAYGDFRIRF